MKCPYCGMNIRDNIVECGYCGNKIPSHSGKPVAGGSKPPISGSTPVAKEENKFNNLQMSPELGMKRKVVFLHTFSLAKRSVSVPSMCQ